MAYISVGWGRSGTLRIQMALGDFTEAGAATWGVQGAVPFCELRAGLFAAGGQDIARAGGRVGFPAQLSGGLVQLSEEREVIAAAGGAVAVAAQACGLEGQEGLEWRTTEHGEKAIQVGHELVLWHKDS